MDAFALRAGSFAMPRFARDDEAEPHLDVSGAAARMMSAVSPVVRQPNTWSGFLVVALAVIVVWQHPIAQRLGTTAPEVTTATAAPALAGSADVALVSTAAPPLPAGLTAPEQYVAEHAPVDPFRPLVTTNGTARAPITIRLPHGRKPAAGPKPAGGSHGTTSASTSNCALTHVVRSGESLWSISARHLAALGYHSVTPAWHAVYAANKAAIGSSPTYLAVGTRLCLPSH